MGFWSNKFNHNITYWAVTGSNGFGGFTFATPVLLKGRWEDRVEQFRNPRDEEEVSQSIAYLDVDVDIGDYLAEGDFVTTPTSDPTTLDGASRVRQRLRTTSLRSLEALRKVYL